MFIIGLIVLSSCSFVSYSCFLSFKHAIRIFLRNPMTKPDYIHIHTYIETNARRGNLIKSITHEPVRTPNVKKRCINFVAK